jgi:hypothetical protein
MMAMRRLALATLAWVVVSTGTARAAGYPGEYALRPLQLPGSMVQLKVPLVMDLSRGNAGDLVFMPFELRIGISSQTELRIFQPGTSLCLRGCGKAYNDLGVGLLFAVMREAGFDMSLLTALEIASFSDPALLRVDGGMAFKFVHAPISVFFSPYVSLGLNHRERNGDAIKIPFELAVQLSYPTALFFETGLYGPLHDSGGWSTPFGVGVNTLVTHGVDLGAEFKFTDQHSDHRQLIVYGAIRN